MIVVFLQVRGWARVAPLSCILLPHKRYRKPKHKEVDNPTSVSVHPTLPGAESSANIAEHHCESHTGPSNSFKKNSSLNQQMGCWSNTAVAALQADASEWTVLHAVQKTASHLLLEERLKEENTHLQPHYLSSKYSVSENRPAKPQKHNHRPNSTVVPIKNFTFLPPIKSPHLNPKLGGQLCNDKKATEDEALLENGLMCDKKNEMRGPRVDPVANTEFSTYSAALTSKYQTCQHNLNLFSAVNVSVPKRFQVPMSSKRDTVHCTSYSMGKSITPALHSTTAVGAQGHMHPSYLFS